MLLGTEIFREIIHDLDVNDIPLRYISAAIYMDDFGEEQFAMGEELAKLMVRSIPYDKIASITIILNVQLVIDDINEEVTQLFANIFPKSDNQ